jgi:hypothetical protein
MTVRCISNAQKAALANKRGITAGPVVDQVEGVVKSLITKGNATAGPIVVALIAAAQTVIVDRSVMVTAALSVQANGIAISQAVRSL